MFSEGRSRPRLYSTSLSLSVVGHFAWYVRLHVWVYTRSGRSPGFPAHFAISARFARRFDCSALRTPTRWHLRTSRPFRSSRSSRIDVQLNSISTPLAMLHLPKTRFAVASVSNSGLVLRRLGWYLSCLKCTRPSQPCLCHPDIRYVVAAGTDLPTLAATGPSIAVTDFKHASVTNFAGHANTTGRNRGLANAAFTNTALANTSAT